MSYDALSRHYDRLMGDFPYARYLDYISPIAGKKALDLACGTGRVACALAKAGMITHGVDLSPEMLNIAVKRAREAGLTVTFENADMRKFAPTEYDLICCVSDGLNYIDGTGLQALFERVKASLTNEGKMVFDVSTPYKLKEVLGNNLFYEDYDDLTYYWQNKWSEKKHSVSMELTFFEREKDVYRRYDERQTQYAHSREELENALEKAGLYVQSRVDGDTFGKAGAKSLRWVYTVKKR